jgi:hypothetical protein
VGVGSSLICRESKLWRPFSFHSRWVDIVDEMRMVEEFWPSDVYLYLPMTNGVAVGLSKHIEYMRGFWILLITK